MRLSCRFTGAKKTAQLAGAYSFSTPTALRNLIDDNYAFIHESSTLRSTPVRNLGPFHTSMILWETGGKFCL